MPECGHPNAVHVGLGFCGPCYARRPETKERQRVAYKKKFQGKVYPWNIKQYGLTVDDYDKLVKQQNNRCRLCDKKCPTGRKLGVDHDHKTGKVRGLLCQRCNVGLGYFYDKPDILRKAAKICERNSKMNDRTQGVMFSTQSDEWGTPQDLFDELNEEFGFEVDLAAQAHNAKCPLWVGPGHSDIKESA